MGKEKMAQKMAKAGGNRRDWRAIGARLRDAVPRDVPPRERLARATDALWDSLSGLGVAWLGFYEIAETRNEMILVACRPKPACSPIGLHGVCGTAWKTRRPEIVPDCHALGENHIVCDPANLSELVVPLIEADGSCNLVLDLDSRELGSFSAEDAKGLAAALDAAGLSAQNETGH